MRCLYVVGCNSWHTNLCNTFATNKQTWLQYNKNITGWFDRDFRTLLKDYGCFYVYGHTIGQDYKFIDEIKYNRSTDEKINFNQKNVKLRQGIRDLQYNLGGKVSVVYKIDKQPLSFNEKHPPPDKTAPPFEAYDIEEGHCEIIDPYSYRFAYETWLHVADIIRIDSKSYKEFRFGGGQSIDRLRDLKGRGIFPVGLHPDHRKLLEFD